MLKIIASNFFTDRTQKNSLTVLFGTFINVGTGGLFFIILPKILSPASYGIFSAAIATGLAINSIANFGIDTGILRFSTDRQKSKESLSIAFVSYLILGIASALVGVIFSNAVALFLKEPQLANLIKIAFTFNIFLLLTNYYVAALQAKQEFMKASIVNWVSNLTRLFLVLAFSYFMALNLTTATFIFFIVPLVSIILGQIFCPVNLINVEKHQIKEFFKYNQWIALTLVVASIPFDNYYLLRYAGAFQAGIYMAPFKILTVFYQFGGNLTRVFATSLNNTNPTQNLKSFVQKSLPTIFIFILTLIFIIILRRPLTSLLFTKEYQQVPQLLLILSIGFIFFFLNTIPSSIILYRLAKSNVSFTISFVKYISFTLLLILFVPRAGAVGAAYAFSASELVSLLLMSSYVLFGRVNK